MAIEIESHIININPDLVRTKLLALGAQLVGKYNFRRYVFNTIPAKSGRWVRLRTDGQTTTLTVKEISKTTKDGTAEWEVTVSNFLEALQILEKIGLKPHSYQENNREEHRLGDTLFMLDSWPILGNLLEIEVKNPNDIEKYALQLGFESTDLTNKDINTLFSNIGVDLNQTPDLRF